MPSAEASRIRAPSVKVVADDEVDVAVAIDIGPAGGVGVPAFAAGRDFLTSEALGRQMRLVEPSPPVALQKRDRRASPIGDDDVRQPIFVEVARQAVRRAHRGAVEQRSTGVKAKGAKRSPVPGTGATITWSVRVST